MQKLLHYDNDEYFKRNKGVEKGHVCEYPPLVHLLNAIMFSFHCI